MELDKLDPEKICRICLKETSELFLIFDEAYALNGETTVSKILAECTQFRVERYDELPHQICHPCKEAAFSAYRFKLQAENSYITLTRIFHLGTLKMKTKDCIERETQTDADVSSTFYPCEQCNEKFYSVFYLREHRRLHHRDSIPKCKVCLHEFGSMRQLRSHLMQKHPDEGLISEIKCPVCYRLFSRKDHMLRHLKNIHKHNINSKSSLEEPEIDITLGDINLELTKIKCTDSESDNNENEEDATNPISSDDEQNSTIEKQEEENFLEHLKIEPELIIKVEETDGVGVENVPDVISEEELNSKRENNGENCEFDRKFAKKGIHNKNIKINQSKDKDNRNNLQNDENTNISGPVTKKSKSKNHARIFISNVNQCKMCSREFTRPSHLQRHMLTHLDEKPHACIHCPKRFGRSDHLKNHIASMHNDKEFKCDKCDLAFTRNESLIRHKESKHGVGPNIHKIFNCEYCNKKFTTRSYLHKHNLLHTDRIYACKHCEETFKDRKLFREHEKTHSGDRNFLCSICGESFQRNDYLLVHMRRHTGEKPYKCQYCGKGFPRTTDVKMHERYHTGTKPNLCNLCGKSFHRAYNLTIHMRTHTGERPFKCDQCDKSFTQSNDLKSHIRRHTGERFRCNNCDAAFLQLYGLRQHALLVHGVHIESSTGRLQKFPPSNPLTFPTATSVSSSVAPVAQTPIESEHTPV